MDNLESLMGQTGSKDAKLPNAPNAMPKSPEGPKKVAEGKGLLEDVERFVTASLTQVVDLFNPFKLVSSIFG